MAKLLGLEEWGCGEKWTQWKISVIVSVLQSIGSKCWPRDCIGDLVFGITLPSEFNKLYSDNKDALVLLIFCGEIGWMISEGSGSIKNRMCNESSRWYCKQLPDG